MKLPTFALLVAALALSACVTVNVYFPAAAAERVADQIVREVYGLEPRAEPRSEAAPDATPAAPVDPGAQLVPKPTGPWLRVQFIASAAAQQPNIDVSSPTIARLTAALRARHAELVPYYSSGAVGLGSNGLLVFRDSAAVSLKDRPKVTELVAAENRERNALYAEIARENGHPEWERDIRTIFDRRWVANAPPGWWFQNASNEWVQK